MVVLFVICLKIYYTEENSIVDFFAEREEVPMERKVAIGIQSFDKLRVDNYFYVDKTSFIKEWWESGIVLL